MSNNKIFFSKYYKSFHKNINLMVFTLLHDKGIERIEEIQAVFIPNELNILTLRITKVKT